MAIWKYKVEDGLLSDAHLNLLGSSGWELVTVIGNEYGETTKMFFKKQAK